MHIHTCLYIYIYIVVYTFGLTGATSTRRPQLNQKCEGLLATFLATSFRNSFSKVLSSLCFYPFSFLGMGLRPSTYSEPFL